MDASEPATGGAPLDRRSLLRRTAITGGALVWATPAVQTLASPAFAAGSPLCQTRVETEDCVITYRESPECCECVEDHRELPLADALALCASQGVCDELLEVCGEEEEKPPPPEQPPGEVPDVAGEQDSDVPTVIPAGQ